MNLTVHRSICGAPLDEGSGFHSGMGLICLGCLGAGGADSAVAVLPAAPRPLLWPNHPILWVFLATAFAVTFRPFAADLFGAAGLGVNFIAGAAAIATAHLLDWILGRDLDLFDL